MHAAATTAHDGPTNPTTLASRNLIAAVNDITAVRFSFKVRRIPDDLPDDFDVVAAKKNEVLQSRTPTERADIERLRAERRVYLGIGVGLEDVPASLAEHGFVLTSARCVTRLVRELWADELEDPDNYDPLEIHRLNFVFHLGGKPLPQDKVQTLEDDGMFMFRFCCESALWRTDMTRNPLPEGGTGWSANCNHRAAFILADGTPVGAYKRDAEGRKIRPHDRQTGKRNEREFVPLQAERFLSFGGGNLIETLNV